MKSISLVVVPNGIALGVVTLTSIESQMKIALLGISIVYTCWRWRRDFRRDRKRDLIRDFNRDAEADKE